MQDNQCLHAHYDTDTSGVIEDNQVVSNAIYECSGEQSIGKAWGPGGSLNSRGNQYQSNQYHVADSTSSWFADADSADQYVSEDWTAWQQGNHDSQGALTVGCTYTSGGQVSTTTTLSLAPASVNVKSSGPVVMTAIVKPAVGSGVPSGTVNFFNGSSQIGSATLNNGAAALNYNPSALAAGAYSITATYLQNNNFGGSTSAPQGLNVQDFQIAANPTTVTVSTPGGGGATTLTLTPLGGFNQTVSYTCTGLPSGSTCAFTPISATSEKLTIQTTAPSARLNEHSVLHGRAILYALLLPGLFGLTLSARNRTRTLHELRTLGLVALLTVSTLGMSACAGISSASQTITPTAAGSFPVTVTATTGGTNPLNHIVMVTLTVQ